MRRCVVSVGTGYYRGAMDRLRVATQKFGNCEFKGWTDPLPDEWPTHTNVPYGFKAMALRWAMDQDFDCVFWCDSVILPIRPLEPLWERVQRVGYFIADAGNGANNYQWTADSAYKDLFPGMDIGQAREISKGFLQVHAAVMGLNLRSEIGIEFLSEYYRLATTTKAFCGSWTNTNGDCGPSDVKGHRHDQTAASLIAHRLGMNLDTFPEPYAYSKPAPGTILLHDGSLSFGS